MLLLCGSAAAQDYGTSPVPSDSVGYTMRFLRYHQRMGEISIAYPEITRFPKRPRRALNHILHDRALAAFREERANMSEPEPEFAGNESSSADCDTRLWFLDSDLVSVLSSWDIYSPGMPHPGNFYLSCVFRREGDSVREIMLDDLFRPNSGYDSVLTELVVKDVLTRDPDHVWSDGAELREGWSHGGLQGFALTRRGILLVGWPGPRVNGPIEVLIPYEAIASYLDPKGALGKWSK